MGVKDKMATQTMPLRILVDRNQYICDRMKIELSSQKQDVCFLYSKEGMQFRIHKAIMMQTERFRNILTSTLCCRGNCSGSLEPPELFFPDIKAVQLRSLIEFFYTGILRSPCNDPDTLVSMLTNIFGFPNHMRLKRLKTFNQEQQCSVTQWVDKNSSCIVCNASGVPVHELYFHMKSHLEKQYEENLKSLVNSSPFSPCCVCNRLTVFNNLFGEDNKKNFLRAHYEKHVEELEGYMLEKFGWNTQSPKATVNATVSKDLPAAEDSTVNEETSSPPPNFSPLIISTSSIGSHSSGADHTSPEIVPILTNFKLNDLNGVQHETSTFLNEETAKNSNSNVPTSRDESNQALDAGVPTVHINNNSEIHEGASRNDEETQLLESKLSLESSTPTKDENNKDNRRNSNNEIVQKFKTKTMQKAVRRNREQTLLQNKIVSSDDEGEARPPPNKKRLKSKGNRSRPGSSSSLIPPVDAASVSTSASIHESDVKVSKMFSIRDVIHTSAIENVGSFSCTKCKKKVRSNKKLNHAVQHFSFLWPDDKIKCNTKNGAFVCTRQRCDYKCPLTMNEKHQMIHMKEHFAIEHGELEKHLSENNKTLTDLYLTKKPRTSNKGHRHAASYASHAQRLPTIQIDNLNEDTAAYKQTGKCITAEQKTFRPVDDEPQGMLLDVPSTGEKTINDVDGKIKVGAVVGDVHLADLSDISSSSMYNEDGKQDTQKSSNELRTEQEYTKNIYCEIDTEAETDKEDTK